MARRGTAAVTAEIEHDRYDSVQDWAPSLEAAPLPSAETMPLSSLPHSPTGLAGFPGDAMLNGAPGTGTRVGEPGTDTLTGGSAGVDKPGNPSAVDARKLAGVGAVAAGASATMLVSPILTVGLAAAAGAFVAYLELRKPR